LACNAELMQASMTVTDVGAWGGSGAGWSRTLIDNVSAHAHMPTVTSSASQPINTLFISSTLQAQATSAAALTTKAAVRFLVQRAM